MKLFVRLLLLLALTPAAVHAQLTAQTPLAPSDPLVASYEAEALETLGDAAPVEDTQATGGRAVDLRSEGAGFKIALDRLPAGIYALYVCAHGGSVAEPTQMPPLYLEWKLDAFNGSGEQVHRMPVPVSPIGLYEYIAKIYFHAPQERAYRGTLTIAAGSALLPLRVDRVELRNPLGSLQPDPIKKNRTLYDPQRVEALRQSEAQAGRLPQPLRPRPLTAEQRRSLDEQIWTRSIMPLNATPAGSRGPSSADAPAFAPDQAPRDMQQRYAASLAAIDDLSRRYLLLGDLEAAADASLLLVGYAYNYPAYDWSLHGIDNIRDATRTFSPNGPAGRGCDDKSISTAQVAAVLDAYDRLFPYITDNPGLAQRVGRFVPWVSSPADVIQLMDTFLVQRAVLDGKQGILNDQVAIVARQVLGEVAPQPPVQTADPLAFPTGPQPPQPVARIVLDDDGLVNLHLSGIETVTQQRVSARLHRLTHAARIESINYHAGTLTLSQPLPSGIVTLNHRQTLDLTAQPDGSYRYAPSSLLFAGKVEHWLSTGREARLLPLPGDMAPPHVQGIVVDSKGRAIGAGSVGEQGWFFYTGYPEARRHLARIDPADLVDADRDGKTTVTIQAGETTLTAEVTGTRDDGFVLYSRLGTSPLPQAPILSITNENRSHTWLCSAWGPTAGLTLDQPPPNEHDASTFAIHTLRAGTTVTMPTHLRLERTDPAVQGIYTLNADTGFELKLPGRRAYLSSDAGSSWRKADYDASWGNLIITVSDQDVRAAELRLKVQ